MGMSPMIPIEVQKYDVWRETLKRSFCYCCKKSYDGEMITINPPGHFGVEEVLLCKQCLELPENLWAKDRLEEISYISL